MSLGAVIFGVVVGMFGMVMLAQFAMARAGRAMEGQPAPALDGPLGEAVRGSTLVWFHSPTCGPCRVMEGDVRRLADRGALHIVDVSQRLDIAQAFGIMATPTTVQIRDGQVLAVRTGVLRGDVLGEMAA